jgi:hypothetical protein
MTEDDYINHIAVTLGCATCLWEGKPTGTFRALLVQAKDQGLDWHRIYQRVAQMTRFLERLPTIDDVAPDQP